VTPAAASAGYSWRAVAAAATAARAGQARLQPQHQTRSRHRLKESGRSLHSHHHPASQTVTFGTGDACRALSPAALGAGLPALLNEVRRMLLTTQPLQAQRAAAQLHELALEMQAAGTVATMRRALAVLQQQPEVAADDGLNADIENENAMLLLQAWQALCCAAVASMISGSEREDCGTP
jgi:hypothetical protein